MTRRHLDGPGTLDSSYLSWGARPRPGRHSEKGSYMVRMSATVLTLFAAATLAGCAAPGAGDAKRYRSVTRDGEEYFCRNEAVTGSRLEMHEVCLTRKQMDAAREHTQDEVRRMQSPVYEPDTPNTARGAGG
jgi:hypothetical protein